MLFIQKFREVYAAGKSALFLRVGPQTDIFWDRFAQMKYVLITLQTVVRTISVEDYFIIINFFVLSKLPIERR